MNIICSSLFVPFSLSFSASKDLLTSSFDLTWGLHVVCIWRRGKPAAFQAFPIADHEENFLFFKGIQKHLESSNYSSRGRLSVIYYIRRPLFWSDHLRIWCVGQLFLSLFVVVVQSGKYSRLVTPQEDHLCHARHEESISGGSRFLFSLLKYFHLNSYSIFCLCLVSPLWIILESRRRNQQTNIEQWELLLLHKTV